MGASPILSIVLQLASVNKKLSKLNQTWAKFKNTPNSISLLLKDLKILLAGIIAVAEDDGSCRQSNVTTGALDELSKTLLHLQTLSNKYTARIGRKSLTIDNLRDLELRFADSKIRLLLIQFWLERREASQSRAVVAEELAQLYFRPEPRQSLDRANREGTGFKADSLLSFKCYSELVGREKVLLQLDAEFRNSNAVALVGPGGMSKTQIAVEYAIRVQERHTDCYVFWVDCGSSISLESSYRTIAESLKIPGFDDPRVDILERTRTTLNQFKAARWFIILQNVSESSLRWENSSALSTVDYNHFPLCLATYLPESPRGQTLCISCENSAISKLLGDCPTILIQPLIDSEAAMLLSSKIPKEMDIISSLSALTKTLNYVPFAICQAAAYLVVTRCDAQAYLKLLLAMNKSSTLCDASYKTTSISFVSVQKQNARATNLLAIMAVSYRRNISKTYLWHAWKYGFSDLLGNPGIPDLDMSDKIASPERMSHVEQADYVEFAAALATLESYLLVQYDARSETYSLHRIVQAAVLSILESHGTLSTWTSSAMVLLSGFTHACRPTSRIHARISLPNMMLQISQVVQEAAPTGICAGLAKAKILCDVAALKIASIQPKASTPLLQEAYQIQKGLLKPQDPRILRTLLALAESTVHSDSSLAAIPLFVEAIAGHKQILGPGNRKTLFAQVNLCSNLVLVGDISAAAPVHYEAQAAVSASLQISTDDRRRLQQKLSELKTMLSLAQQRQAKHGTASRSMSMEDLQTKNRLSGLHSDRKQRISIVRAFTTNSRVGSLDSIVEMFEV